MDSNLVEGCRIWWEALQQGGVLARIDGRKGRIFLDAGESRTVNLGAGQIVRVPFVPEDRVQDSGGRRGRVVAEVSESDYPSYRIEWLDGSNSVVAEAHLRPAVIRDPVERLAARELGTSDDFNLRCVAADMWARNRGDELVSLNHARIDLKPHQVGVAHRVVTNYPHRFLLCDEVGLGKTIEAAMVIKELRARGLARRVLILTPANLQRQWQFELKTKFNEVFSIYNRITLQSIEQEHAENPWSVHDSIITSHQFASRDEERRRQIFETPWDLVVVDEAHHARRTRQGNRIQQTNFFQLMQELVTKPENARRSCLLLTATPMQLQPYELFSLVEMLRPTLFASEQDFEDHRIARKGISQLAEEIEASASDQPDHSIVERASIMLGLRPSDIQTRFQTSADLSAELRSHHRLSEVLIRNRRAMVGGFTARHAFRIPVQLTEPERHIQDAMDEIIREGYERSQKEQRNAVGFLMVIWQKLAASSSRALRLSLERRCERLLAGNTGDRLSEDAIEETTDEDESLIELSGDVSAAIDAEIERLQAVIKLTQEVVIDSKASALIEKMSEIFTDNHDEKILIFTEFRETQEMLRELIVENGWGCWLFHGQMDALAKDTEIERFRDSDGPQVLICTEAGGEGRNLQFAHLMVNYDLPWNPMRIEQRIGRIDRLGQEHPVSVFNFHIEGTIEGRILDVLEQRIDLFTSSIGGLEPILGETEIDIRKALRLSAAARDRELAKLGQRLDKQMKMARQAEEQAQDFVLDDTSRYIANITGFAQGVTINTVSQAEYEEMATRLLRSVKTWIGPPDDKSRPEGERVVHFHPPLSTERHDLIGNHERCRVCFDPHVNIDSAEVEFLGFGHPIIDALVRRVTEELSDGAATVRVLDRARVGGVRSGWQFVYRMRFGDARQSEEVISVFIDDGSEPDLDLGAKLLLLSREFHHREQVPHDMPTVSISTERVRVAQEIAERQMIQRRDGELAKRRATAREAFDTALDRVERRFDVIRAAARDRLRHDEQTLKQLRESSSEDDHRVVPIWEANVRRAKDEVERTRAEREQAINDLERGLSPNVEYSLLGVARIVPAN